MSGGLSRHDAMSPMLLFYLISSKQFFLCKFIGHWLWLFFWLRRSVAFFFRSTHTSEVWENTLNLTDPTERLDWTEFVVAIRYLNFISLSSESHTSFLHSQICSIFNYSALVVRGCSVSGSTRLPTKLISLSFLIHSTSWYFLNYWLARDTAISCDVSCTNFSRHHSRIRADDEYVKMLKGKILHFTESREKRKSRNENFLTAALKFIGKIININIQKIRWYFFMFIFLVVYLLF